MVQENVALANRVEDARGRVENVSRRRKERRVLQGRQVELHHRHQVRGAERAGDLVDVARVELELRAQELPDVLRAAVFDLETDRRAETAAAQVVGHAPEQVAGLVLPDLDVGVARDAEGRSAQDLHPGKQAVEIGLDELLEQDELERLARGPGHRDEPRQRSRDLDPREGGRLLLLVLELDGERQGQIGDERKRVRGIESEGRQDREDHAFEVSREFLAALGLDLVPGQDPDAGLGEARPQLVPEEAHRLARVAVHDLADRLQLLGRGEAVRAALRDRRFELLVEARDPDHEELVEVGVKDREELHPFEERPARIERLFEHAAVERQPGNLAIEVERMVFEPVVRRLAPTDVMDFAHRDRIEGWRVPPRSARSVKPGVRSVTKILSRYYCGAFIYLYICK